MSALPPIATAKADFGKPSCLLYPPIADMCGAPTDVRFTPDSDRESGPPQTAMSALLSKADMCGAVPHVCFGPIADIGP